MGTDVIISRQELTGLSLAGDSNFMPAMSMAHAVARYNAVLEFTQTIMKGGKDYGKVPGTEKNCLLKPGAEKLCSFFGITPRLKVIAQVEDWTGKEHGEPFFYYHYQVQLWRGATLLGEADGSANSMESKHRYRWVSEDQVPPHLPKAQLKQRGGRQSEFCFSIDKAETTGKYGKPASYWQEWKAAIADGRAVQVRKPTKAGKEFDAWEMDSTLFRIPNPDIADSVNTLQKMAFKRAMVAAVLIVCNASEFFTQDVDDQEPIEAAARAQETEPAEQTRQQAPAKANGSAPATPSISKDQWQEIKGRLAATGFSLSEFLGKFGATRGSELPASRFGEMRDFLNSLGEPAAEEPKPASREQRDLIAAAAEHSAPVEQTAEPPPPASHEQLDQIAAEIVRTGTTPAESQGLMAVFGVQTFDDLTEAQAAAILERLAKREGVPPTDPVEDQGGLEDEVRDLLADIDGLADPLTADALRGKIDGARKRLGAPCADDLLAKVDERLRQLEKRKPSRAGKK